MEAPFVKPRDRLLELDGAKAATKVLSDLLAAKKPGGTVTIRFFRNGAEQIAEITLGRNTKPIYTVAPIPEPGPLPASIFKDWLRKMS